MKREDARYDQRVRVNVPGVGDHGHVGTVKRIRGGVCSVHLDRDQRPRHLFVYFAGDLDPIVDERSGATVMEAAPVEPSDGVLPRNAAALAAQVMTQVQAADAPG